MMYTRNNFETELLFLGENKKIASCPGPVPSMNFGMDYPCCLRCQNIKNCIVRSEFNGTTNRNTYGYLMELKEKKIVPDVMTAISISNCDKDGPVMIYKCNINTELKHSFYILPLLSQLRLLAEKGLVIKSFSDSDFALTSMDMPVFIPNFENGNIEQRISYGGDQGVEFKKFNYKGEELNLFRVTDRKLAFSSGKWTYLINFYSMLELLAGTKKLVHNVSNGRDKEEYFSVPQNYLLRPHFDFIPKAPIPYELKKAPGSKNDKYVVLDLDSTLIFASSFNLANDLIVSDRIFYVKLVVKKTFFRIMIRKHLNKFLKELLDKKYKLIVWSAASENYVKNIVSRLFKEIPLTYVLTRNHLDNDEYKNLRTIEKYVENFDINNCRLVDDNVIHKKNQEKNFVQIEPFSFSSDMPKDSEDDNVLENFSSVVEKSFL